MDISIEHIVFLVLAYLIGYFVGVFSAIRRLK